MLYSALQRQKKPNKCGGNQMTLCFLCLALPQSVLQNGCNLTPPTWRLNFSVKTYDNYAAQHQAFVNHAEKTIAGLEQQIKDAEAKIEAAEKQVTIFKSRSIF